MKKKYNIAIVGATGLVGREMIKIMEERNFLINDLKLFASSESIGKTIEYKGKHYKVETLHEDGFKNSDIVFMLAGSKISSEFAPKAVKKGAIVIDNSSYFRMNKDIPLIIPEINPEKISLYKKCGIIANPNCSTIQLLIALKPLHQEAHLKRIIVSTYQAVSGAGKKAMDELAEQTSSLFNQHEINSDVFQKRIAFNCLPQIDLLDSNKYTLEENKMLFETRKIMDLPDLGVCATCVRVPVFNGHAESIVAEFEKEINAEKAYQLLEKSPDISLIDKNKNNTYPTQIDCEDSDAILVGRVRDDFSAPNSIAFWCVANNLRKGAALNAIQIAEIIVKDYL